jgi:hypothetical protein
MLERRKAFRGRVYYGGRIAFNGRKSTIDCVVRNFTSAGVKVEFADAPTLPAEVDLTIARKGTAYIADLVWQRRNRAGFAFRTPTPAQPDMTLDWALRLRASERARKFLQIKVGELSTIR